jgi:hypothetical protein
MDKLWNFDVVSRSRFISLPRERQQHSAGVPFDRVGICVSLLMYTKRTRVRRFCRRCPPSNSFVVSSRALRPPFPGNWCLPICFTKL